MDNTMKLGQSVLQDVVALLDNQQAMKKLQKYISRLKNESTQAKCSSAKGEDLNDLREALGELKLMKQGKLKGRPVEELLNEL